MHQSGFKPVTQLAVKRLLDFTVASLGLVALSPILGLIALAIRLEGSGPVIYRHKRIGKDGQVFDLLKFRSMVVGGDDQSYMLYLKELIESQENGQGLPYRKMEGDPRITRIGRILRTFYLDELPQLWNVVAGDMSLVGPRPHVQFEVDHYSSEQCRRLSVRPGLTGLWQVEGKADCTFNELIVLDLDYIDRWNPWLDIQILFRTFTLLLKGGEGFWARMAKRIPLRTNGSKPASPPAPLPDPRQPTAQGEPFNAASPVPGTYQHALRGTPVDSYESITQP